MKFILLLALNIMSGCCLVTSQDCGCKPPNPELLTDARYWIEPYQEELPFVYKSDDGELDTFTISKNSTTEFCGGDECGSNVFDLGWILISKNTGIHIASKIPIPTNYRISRSCG